VVGLGAAGGVVGAAAGAVVGAGAEAVEHAALTEMAAADSRLKRRIVRRVSRRSRQPPVVVKSSIDAIHSTPGAAHNGALDGIIDAPTCGVNETGLC
jgi:hypothetical protein